ncbi:hypothetical protein JCM8202_004477 [Rhodotorula sphaerocarpa]
MSAQQEPPRKRARRSASGSATPAPPAASSSSAAANLTAAEAAQLEGGAGTSMQLDPSLYTEATVLSASSREGQAYGTSLDLLVSEDRPTTDDGSNSGSQAIGARRDPFGTTSTGGDLGQSATASVQLNGTPVVNLGDSDEEDDLYAPGPSTLTETLPRSTRTKREDEDEILFVPDRAYAADAKGKTPASSSNPPLAASPPLPLQDANPTDLPGPSEPAPKSLAHLECPICCGPPTPLALTSCGHAFCAPCLHAALVSAPALTPPPPGSGAGFGFGAGLGGATGPALARRGRGFAGVGGGGGGGRRGTAANGTRGRRGGRTGRGDPYDDGAASDDGDPELNKRCPLCRSPLYGGWGKSLRGLVLRMAPKNR